MINRAFVVNKIDDKFISAIQELVIPTINENEVLIKVTYSSVNFKDALSSVGNSGVTRNFPHVTGIDVAGTIQQSNSGKFKEGDEVLVTGYDMGMNSDGGHQSFVKVPDAWVIKKPTDISDKEIMTYGTAGLTAGLSINELLNNGIGVESGEILVTGATGGVGSIAVAILSKLGFNVVAISAKEEKIPFLKELGAKEVILRKDFDVENKKPMVKERFAGIVDTVGGNILTEALKALKYDGVATCCGLTSSFKLNTNVFPFILRGARLIGIDSVECKIEKKLSIWNKLANEFKIDSLENLTTEISLEDLPEAYKTLLDAKAVGRYLVKI
ncbi:YhdH/YhfP family quinone oxidoreductase [Sulfurimonas sp.]|uniref:YhdH/YhfP family quinone oxidoreductase n=1 Tax=Sulfurimonas sp. TaxID=2022749 RepID=UPI002B484D19|nr:YhdH/YhfP family quinone oxidoreductase [Sulfurimonas sp.]